MRKRNLRFRYVIRARLRYTTSAAIVSSSIVDDDKHTILPLRIFVSGGGCDGDGDGSREKKTNNYRALERDTVQLCVCVCCGRTLITMPFY